MILGRLQLLLGTIKYCTALYHYDSALQWRCLMLYNLSEGSHMGQWPIERALYLCWYWSEG